MDRWTRRAPLTAVAFVALLVAAFALNWSTPNSDASPAKVLSYYQRHRGDALASNFLGGLAVVFFLFFAASLRSYLRRTGHSDGLIGLGLMGSVLIAVGGTLFASFGLALSDHPSLLQPSTAQALNLLSNDAFFPIAAGTATFLIGNGLAIARAAVLPRWVGWVAFVVGILGASPVGFFAFFVLMLWTLVVGVLIFARGATTVQPPPATPAASATVT